MTKKNFIKCLTFMTLLCVTVIGTLSCSNKNSSKYQFKSAQEALSACRGELAKLQGIREASTKELTGLVKEWIEMQDSVYSYLSNDTTINVNDATVMIYYSVSDSIRTEVGRLVRGKKRSLKEIFTLKVYTVRDRDKIISSKNYKEALSYFEVLDQKEPEFNNADEMINGYLELLDTTEPFKRIDEVLDFMAKEDECFRALMKFLDETPQHSLAEISQKTALFYGDVYDGIQENPDNEVGMRMKVYLAIRGNRRIVQNANVCAANLKAKKKLSDESLVNYRWMLIQPFITIQDEYLAALTNQQIADLQKLADELPGLIARIDKQKGQKPDEIKKNLSEFFITAFLNTI